MKSSSLAYNRHETRDKRPLGRDSRSWCHNHTSVKLSYSQPMDPWTERRNTRMLPKMCMEPWAATKQALHQCGGNTSSCPDTYPMAACAEFHVVVGQAENFSSCPHIAPAHTSLLGRERVAKSNNLLTNFSRKTDNLTYDGSSETNIMTRASTLIIFMCVLNGIRGSVNK